MFKQVEGCHVFDVNDLTLTVLIQLYVTEQPAELKDFISIFISHSNIL